jgi:hypothetical protein
MLGDWPLKLFPPGSQFLATRAIGSEMCDGDCEEGFAALTSGCSADGPDQLGFSDFFESSPSKCLSTSSRLSEFFTSVNTTE